MAAQAALLALRCNIPSPPFLTWWLQVYRLATTFWDDMGSVHATSTGGNPQPGGDTGCASSSMTEGASCGPGMAGGEAGADGAPAAATPRAVAAQAGQAVAPMALDMVSGEVLEALKASSRWVAHDRVTHDESKDVPHCSVELGGILALGC